MQKIPVAQIDSYLFRFINGYSKKSRILDFFGIFCATYLGLAFVIFLAGFSFFSNNWQIFFVPTAAGIFARFFINEAVYFFYKRKRPVVLGLIKKPDHPAFPSGHAAFFFALSFALFLFNPPLAVIFTIASACISAARVFCGVHWPSDIVGGIGSAGISFLIVYLILAVA